MPATPILGLPYPTSADTADVPRDIKALADKMDPLGVVPVGALFMWLKPDPPNSAWLICDGHPVLVADYPALALVLGSQGGQIVLPDLKNRFPIGAGDTPVGGQGGANTVALSSAQMPQHNHGITDPGHNHPIAGVGDHGHNLSIANAATVDPAHVYAVAGGIGYVTAVLSGPNLPIPYSTADAWHGEQGNHGHIGSTAVPSGAHNHTLTAVATGISTQNAGSPVGDGNLSHENRPLFLAVNYIIRAL